ncbi:hypothetical protein T484DRAFT_1986816 [Baffinella frigidus]|nr:hypothetical protein T484DRAFT_1986816 [Cryptophyta sp. CCMP2293]
MEVVSLSGLDRASLFASDLYIEFRVQMGLVDRRQVAHSTFVDLLLLAECDYLVGTFSSAFSAVALELSISRKGFVPPYISLDIPWKPFRPYQPHPGVSMQNVPRA